MNSKTLIVITIILLATLATAKPLVKQNSEVNAPSELHKLIKRATNAKESSSKTGFAAVMATTQSKNRQKRRVCKEWAKQEITGQWKCIDFLEKEVK
jgi:hypothetical protein